MTQRRTRIPSNTVTALLTEAGYRFTVVKPDVDESAFTTDGVSVCEYARKLALAKANSVASEYPNSLVIAADTVVDFRGQIIGKPTDAKDARYITEKLFSTPHKVITGVAIVRHADGMREDVPGLGNALHEAEQVPELLRAEARRHRLRVRRGDVHLDGDIVLDRAAHERLDRVSVHLVVHHVLEHLAELHEPPLLEARLHRAERRV